MSYYSIKYIIQFICYPFSIMASIRLGRKEDLQFLVPIQQQVQEIHRSAFPWRFKSMTNEVLLGCLTSQLEDVSSRLLVCEESQRLVGYALIRTIEYKNNEFLLSYRAAYLDQIAILDSYRGSGIGRDLILACKLLLPELGTTRLELDVWEFEGSATEFFRSMGFEVYNRKMSLEVDK